MLASGSDPTCHVGRIKKSLQTTTVKETLDPKAIFVGLRRRIGRSMYRFYARIVHSNGRAELGIK